jgi:predicted nucleic acid-binding protein
VGNGRLKVAVADSGPLIHLTEIHCIHLLHVFDKLYIPNAVWVETVGQNRISQHDLSNATNIQRRSLLRSKVIQFVKEIKITELHTGERECLFLCRQEGISTILTDDMAVRDVAKHMNLIPVGSLGIVVKGYKTKNISLEEAVQYINDLYNVSSLFITHAIVDLAIEQLRQHTIT